MKDFPILGGDGTKTVPPVESLGGGGGGVKDFPILGGDGTKTVPPVETYLIDPAVKGVRFGQRLPTL